MCTSWVTRLGLCSDGFGEWRNRSSKNPECIQGSLDARLTGVSSGLEPVKPSFLGATVRFTDEEPEFQSDEAVRAGHQLRSGMAP